MNSWRLDPRESYLNFDVGWAERSESPPGRLRKWWDSQCSAHPIGCPRTKTDWHTYCRPGPRHVKMCGNILALQTNTQHGTSIQHDKPTRSIEPRDPPAACRPGHDRPRLACRLHGPGDVRGGRLKSPGCNGSDCRDLRNLLWASIDNDDSRDLDQLSVAEALPGDKIKVLVAIADVDAVVAGLAAIEEHARHNTTSV